MCVCVCVCLRPGASGGRAWALAARPGGGLGLEGEQVFEIERMFGANVCSIQAPGRRAAGGGQTPECPERGQTGPVRRSIAMGGG